MCKNSFVLISACRNEEDYVDGLCDTIAAQTLKPARWILVDDGSTDATGERAARRGVELPFLEVASMPKGGPRSFASQVYAAQHGYELIKHLDFQFVGFLDADIRLQPDYYEKLVAKFALDAKLGLAGGVVVDKYPDRIERIRYGSEQYHVAGGVQFFRRECFDAIGGYVPIQGGGQDTIADVMAMMTGWRIQACRDMEPLHLRPEGFGKAGLLRRSMAWGNKFYLLGYDPMFYFGQCARRLAHRPFLLGSLCQAFGYLVASARRPQRPVSDEFVRYLRNLQRRRIAGALGFDIGLPKTSN